MIPSRAAVLALGVALTGAPALAWSAAPAKPSEADWRVPVAENVMVIDTNKGRVIVELVPQVAPGHVARVQELTRAGVYDGRTFFRVIDRFMAQTGEETGGYRVFEENLNYTAAELFRQWPTHFPSLAFAVGVYLPLSSSTPIFVGGLVRWLGDRRQRKQQTRVLTDEEAAAASDRSPGVLLSSGYIAGGAIAGIVIAFLAGVLDNVDADLTAWAERANPLFAGPNSDALSMLRGSNVMV